MYSTFKASKHQITTLPHYHIITLIELSPDFDTWASQPILTSLEQKKRSKKYFLCQTSYSNPLNFNLGVPVSKSGDRKQA